MQRREFITLLGGAAAAWPLAARSQPSKVVRIGALYIGLADAKWFILELRDGLRELGYVEGRHCIRVPLCGRKAGSASRACVRADPA